MVEARRHRHSASIVVAAVAGRGYEVVVASPLGSYGILLLPLPATPARSHFCAITGGALEVTCAHRRHIVAEEVCAAAAVAGRVLGVVAASPLQSSSSLHCKSSRNYRRHS